MGRVVAVPDDVAVDDAELVTDAEFDIAEFDDDQTELDDLDTNGQVLSIRRADGQEILSIIAQDDQWNVDLQPGGVIQDAFIGSRLNTPVWVSALDGSDARRIAGFEHGDKVFDTSHDRQPIEQRAAESQHQAALVRSHLQRFDIQTTPGLYLADLRRCRQQRVCHPQGALQPSHHLWLDDPITLNTEANQLLPGSLLVPGTVTRMRGDGVKVSGPVDGDPLQIIQPPEIDGSGMQERWLQGGTTNAAVDMHAQQAQRVPLFVLDDKETPVRQLPNSRRFIGAGQGAEAGEWVKLHVCGLC